ncbi:leech-derived tryptase inhibitor C-like [Drosophila takahashii]|uniref:leech-derived tryptase inhibitor C-like n=1 Tax=Drosophila takahashii TaxID=29030 RepID=UPI001CF81E80|nr:leech-derived tryptase inhibitor C-like [Drosophila takahashii]
MRWPIQIALCLLALLGLSAANEPMRLCPCFKIYSPVCGSDNVTYANDCELECQAKDKPITKVKEGKC